MGLKFGGALKFYVGQDQKFYAIEELNSLKRLQGRKLDNMIQVGIKNFHGFCF